MALVLELIVEALEYEDVKAVLPLRVHVLKHVEHFVYKQHIREGNVPLAYVENKSLDSRVNLLMTDRSYTVPENSQRVLESRGAVDRVSSVSYTSGYKDVAATNRTYVDARGKLQPLFFRHELPEGVTECSVQRIKNGNRLEVEAGVDIDIATRSVYTNHVNHFNEDTGSYSVYLVQYSLADGTGGRDILSPQPVVREATWEDLDPATGQPVTTHPLYTRVSNSGTYSFFFNMGGTWYIRPLAEGLVQARPPAGRDPDEPWYIRFTNGDIMGLANGALYRYWVPEFTAQPFLPYSPLVFSTANKFLRVNSRIIKATRGGLEVDPSEGLHLDLEVRDAEGLVVAAYSTNQSRTGTRFSDTGIFWDTEAVDSWDSRSGMVLLNEQVLPEHEVTGNYYYRADDLEYTAVNLNPLTNRRVRDHMYVFYCVPNADETDQAIHHLLVTHDGVIVECSQSAGATYPNLQLLDSDGEYNDDTVIGMRYISDTEEQTFVTEYTVGYSNSRAYMILAEVSLADRSVLEDQEVLDVRRRPGLDPQGRQEALESNCRLLQSRYGYGEDGQEVPENGVMILDVPITVLEGYGGHLLQDQVLQAVRRHMPATGYGLVRFTHPTSSVTCSCSSPGLVDLQITWEGPGLTYSLWRSENPEGVWVLVQTFDDPARGVIEHQDAASPGATVYYRVQISEGTTEYPVGDWVSIKVR